MQEQQNVSVGYCTAQKPKQGQRKKSTPHSTPPEGGDRLWYRRVSLQEIVHHQSSSSKLSWSCARTVGLEGTEDAEESDS